MHLEFESERLHFRPLETGDLDLEVALWTDGEVTRFINGDPSTVDEIEELMPAAIKRAGNGCVGIWCLINKSTGEKIGHAVLLPLPVEAENTEFKLLESDDWPDRDVEIGYVLRRSHWYSGYATEACTRLLEFAFQETDLKAVFAVTDPNNHASQRVLKKSGMHAVGLIPAFADQYPGFKLTRAQWAEQRSPK
ncbi:MAG: GNAT family N-acetyltransferase [Paracoccaceae bacterium]